MGRRNYNKLGGGKGVVTMLDCVCVNHSTLISTRVCYYILSTMLTPNPLLSS